MISFQMKDVPWVELLTLHLIHNLKDVPLVRILALYLTHNLHVYLVQRLYDSGNIVHHCSCLRSTFYIFQILYNLYIERLQVGSDNLFQLCHLMKLFRRNENIIHQWNSFSSFMNLFHHFTHYDYDGNSHHHSV